MPEIVKRFVLRKFRGAPVKKITLYVHEEGQEKGLEQEAGGYL